MRPLTLTVALHGNPSHGFYRVRHGRKTVAGLVLPVYMIRLGLPPSRDDVISAVRLCTPSLPVDDLTVVTFLAAKGDQ